MAPSAHHHALIRGVDPLTSGATALDTRGLSGWAAAVPTSTGTMAAGKVLGRAPRTHRLIGPGGAGTSTGTLPVLTPTRGPGVDRSRATGEAAEVGLAVLLEGVAALLAFLAHVEEHGGVTGELLEAGQSVVGGVQAAFEHAQGQRRK